MFLLGGVNDSDEHARALANLINRYGLQGKNKSDCP
jgi:adenine C2-methylase RlmN of 23S rRNA A2503 and tRNA A37